MLSYLKTSVAVGIASLAISSGVLAQDSLAGQRAFYEQLGKSFNQSVDGDLEAALAGYEKILTNGDASDALKRAAAEGKGYIMALQTKDGLENATSAARKFAFRKKSKETTAWLAKAADEFKSDVLRFQLVQVSAMIGGDDPDFSKLALKAEYDRLNETPADFVAKKVKTEINIASGSAKAAEPKPTVATTEKPKPSVKQTITIAKIPNTTYHAKSTTNVRSGPGTDNSVVGSIRKGQEVTIHERHKIGLSGGTWLKIQGKNQFVGASNFNFGKFPEPKKVTTVTKPKTVVPKTPKAEPAKAPKPAASGGSVCNKNSTGPRFKTVGPTKVFKNTTGSLRFTWGPGVSVKTIVGSQAGYWVVRLGAPSPSVNCGYIKQNAPNLKRIN